MDSGPDTGGRRGGAQRRAEPARLEQRRVDPLREPRRLVQGLRHPPAHLVEERCGGHGIGAHELARELKVDRERDQVLLRTVVELPLEAAPLGVAGHASRGREARSSAISARRRSSSSRRDSLCSAFRGIDLRVAGSPRLSVAAPRGVK